MTHKSVLIPVDLMRSPCDPLVFARDMAAETPLCVTLLYVLNLNIQAAGHIYKELCAESEAALRRLARHVFGSEQAVRVVVRMGVPGDEIVAEAKSRPTDLIIMSGSRRHRWKDILRPGTTRRVIDASPCPAMVLPRNYEAEAKTARVPLPTDAPGGGPLLRAA